MLGPNDLVSYDNDLGEGLGFLYGSTLIYEDKKSEGDQIEDKPLKYGGMVWQASLKQSKEASLGCMIRASEAMDCGKGLDTCMGHNIGLEGIIQTMGKAQAANTSHACAWGAHDQLRAWAACMQRADRVDKP